MSFREPRPLFEDMLDAIDDIRRYLGDFDLAAYSKSDMTKAAVERRLQVVTEVARRLGPQAELLCPGQDWRRIRDFGNVLRHAYDGIDDRIVWDALIEHLPALEQAVRSAINRLPPEE